MSFSGPFQGIDLENLSSATPLAQPSLDSLRPEDYKLHQNYFTLEQLLTQETFQVVRSREYLYFGGMQEGLRHGWGVLLGRGSAYEGSFSLGRKMGKGWLQSSSGAVFLGDFTNDRPHGQGLLSHGEEYYMGDFENGAMQGDGLWRKGGEKYVGKWQASRAHGHGIYTSDLSHYQGTPPLTQAISTSSSSTATASNSSPTATSTAATTSTASPTATESTPGAAAPTTGAISSSGCGRGRGCG